MLFIAIARFVNSSLLVSNIVLGGCGVSIPVMSLLIVSKIACQRIFMLSDSGVPRTSVDCSYMPGRITILWEWSINLVSGQNALIFYLKPTLKWTIHKKDILDTWLSLFLTNLLLLQIYIELTISFLIGWKHTVNFWNKALWHCLAADYKHLFDEIFVIYAE